jgi:TonB family protein
MMQNVKYPKEAEKAGASGTVRVHFIVEKDGTLTNVKVPDSVHPALDAEGIRIVKAMPKWAPAKVKGKAVRSKMMLVLPFRLK